ncbi:MAG TPA: CDP-glucose 4,6-dehydratase, partial [Azospirillum sp.]
MTLSPSFWRGRRVFVTGHTGFIGGWTVHVLHGLGAVVHGYALAPPSEPSLHDLTGVGALVSGGPGDVRD